MSAAFFGACFEERGLFRLRGWYYISTPHFAQRKLLPISPISRDSTPAILVFCSAFCICQVGFRGLFSIIFYIYNKWRYTKYMTSVSPLYDDGGPQIQALCNQIVVNAQNIPCRPFCGIPKRLTKSYPEWNAVKFHTCISIQSHNQTSSLETCSPESL